MVILKAPIYPKTFTFHLIVFFSIRETSTVDVGAVARGPL